MPLNTTTILNIAYLMKRIQGVYDDEDEAHTHRHILIRVKKHVNQVSIPSSGLLYTQNLQVSRKKRL